MQEITVGIFAKLTKDGAKDIDVVVHSKDYGRPSPYYVIEDWVDRGLLHGGPIESLELGLQNVVDGHPGYSVKKRIDIKMRERQNQREAQGA
jgi:hypothetical protein